MHNSSDEDCHTNQTGHMARLPYLILICSVPVVYSLLNSNWLYSHLGWLDPWYYFGFGLNYGDPQFQEYNYKISRLPWILYQSAVRSVFSASAAAFVMQYSILLTTGIFLFLTFRRLFDSHSAFLGALFWASYSFSYASGGADYHNSFSGMFFAIAAYCSLRAAQSEQSTDAGWVFLCGIFAALCVHSIIVMVNLMAIPVAIYLVIGQRSLRDCLTSVFFFVLGIGAVTLILCLVNVSNGRDFLFFMRQFKLAATFIADNEHQKSWWNPWSSYWFLEGRFYLWPLAGTFVFSCVQTGVVLARKTANPVRRRNMALLSGIMVFYGLLWLTWQTLGQTALDWVYFAYPLVFPMAGAVAATAAMATPLQISTRQSLVLVLAVAIWVIFLAPTLLHPLLRVESLADSALPIFLAMLAGLGLLASAHRRIWVLLISVCCLSYAAYLAQTGRVMENSQASSPLFTSGFLRTDCNFGQIGANVIEEGHKYLRSHGYRFDRVLIWADSDETVSYSEACTRIGIDLKLRAYYPSLVSTGFNYFAAPWDADELRNIKQDRYDLALTRPSLIVYVTHETERVQALLGNFKAIGATHDNTEITSHALSLRPITLHHFEVTPPK